MKFTSCCSLVAASALSLQATLAVNPRVVILSDINSGAEPDDKQSFIRLLLYSNELDLVGLVGANSQFGPNRGNTKAFLDLIDVYEKIRPNLLVHAPGYPEADALRRVVCNGAKGAVGMAGVGDGRASDGSRLILAELKRDDKRPLWVLGWGGVSTLAQALHDLRAEPLPDAERDRLVAKLRVYDIAGQDDSGAWIANQFPSIPYIRSGRQFMAFSHRKDWAGQPSQDGDLTQVSAPWYREHIQNHGLLGKNYPGARYMFEGDTPSFLYLVRNGLNAPEHPDWGSWGGRFTRERQSPPERYLDKKEAYLPAPMHVSAEDAITFAGKTHKSLFTPLWRWREAVQNDFAARMVWSETADFKAANHPPVVVVNGSRLFSPLVLLVTPGRRVPLNAAGTADPDGDALTCRWSLYPEAGTATAPASLSVFEGLATEVLIPEAIQPGQTLHVVLTVQDAGSPSLTRYRRIVFIAHEKSP